MYIRRGRLAQTYNVFAMLCTCAHSHMRMLDKTDDDALVNILSIPQNNVHRFGHRLGRAAAQAFYHLCRADSRNPGLVSDNIGYTFQRQGSLYSSGQYYDNWHFVLKNHVE